MTLSKHFLDSNIILYLLDINTAKRDIAQELLSFSPVINPQVLVEVGNVCRRKLGFTKKEICNL